MGVFPELRSWGGSGCPRRLLCCLGPKFTLKFGPSPPPLASLGRGAELPREECVNFLTRGSCPCPEWAAFRRGARGAPGFVYF